MTVTSSFNLVPGTTVTINGIDFTLQGHHTGMTWATNYTDLLREFQARGYLSQSIHNNTYFNLTWLPSTLDGAIASGAALHQGNHLQFGDFNFTTQVFQPVVDGIEEIQQREFEQFRQSMGDAAALELSYERAFGRYTGFLNDLTVQFTTPGSNFALTPYDPRATIGLDGTASYMLDRYFSDGVIDQARFDSLDAVRFGMAGVSFDGTNLSGLFSPVDPANSALRAASIQSLFDYAQPLFDAAGTNGTVVTTDMLASHFADAPAPLKGNLYSLKVNQLFSGADGVFALLDFKAAYNLYKVGLSFEAGEALFQASGSLLGAGIFGILGFVVEPESSPAAMMTGATFGSLGGRSLWQNFASSLGYAPFDGWKAITVDGYILPDEQWSSAAGGWVQIQNGQAVAWQDFDPLQSNVSSGQSVTLIDAGLGGFMINQVSAWEEGAWSNATVNFNANGDVTTADILLRSGDRLEYENNSDFNTASVIDTTGSVIATAIGLSDGTTIQRSGAAADPASWQTTVTYVDRSAAYTGQQIGDVFGSALGQFIDTGNVFADITAQTALRTVLANVGETIGLYFANDGSMIAPGVVRADYSLIDAMDASFSDIGTNFAYQMRSAGIGFVASFLAAELAETLDIHDAFGEALFTYTATAANDNVPCEEVRHAA